MPNVIGNRWFVILLHKLILLDVLHLSREEASGHLGNPRCQGTVDASGSWGRSQTHSQQETVLPTPQVRWETYPSPAELQMRLKSQSQSFFVQISCGVITNKIVSLQCGYLIHVHNVKGFPHQVIISINSHVYLFWWEYLNYTITVLSTIFTKLYIRFSDLIHLLFIL